jgi:hypothetical protein
VPTPATPIYRGAVVAGALLVLAVTVPRWFAGPGGGLEDAAGAALSFIAFGTAGALLALSLFVRTVIRFRTLPWPARLAGLTPSVGAAMIATYVWRAL